MYTLYSWRSHLGSAGLYFLHQIPARIVGGPFTAYVAENFTQVSRMTNVHSNSWRCQLGSVGGKLLHQEPARTVGDPFTAYVPGELTQVSRVIDVHPMFLEKSPGYRGSLLTAPRTQSNRSGPIYSLFSWRTLVAWESTFCT